MKKIIFISVLILALSLPMFAKGIYAGQGKRTTYTSANQQVGNHLYGTGSSITVDKALNSTLITQNIKFLTNGSNALKLHGTNIDSSVKSARLSDDVITAKRSDIKPVIGADSVNPSEPIVSPVIKPEIDIPVIDPIPVPAAIEQVRGQKAPSNSPYVYGLPTEKMQDENGLIEVNPPTGYRGSVQVNELRKISKDISLKRKISKDISLKGDKENKSKMLRN